MIERKFWNRKYKEGGISGRGSIGRYRNWKWNKIRQTIGEDFESLVDVGCGDLSFYKHPIANRIIKRKGFKYTGIDVSDFIINKNRVFAPDHEFICAPFHVEQPGLRGQVVFALDLLFHIMDDGEFGMGLENLCNYTNQFLIIYNWQKNPFGESKTDGISQCFRKLGDYQHIFTTNDMQLFETFTVPYDPFGKLYFFKRLIY